MTDPLELNWVPARESSIVVAGIVTGCAEFYAEQSGTGKARPVEVEGAELQMDGAEHARAQGDVVVVMGVLLRRSTEKFSQEEAALLEIRPALQACQCARVCAREAAVYRH
jgi:hypothetical protein